MYVRSDGNRIAWITNEKVGSFGRVYDIDKKVTVGMFAGQTNEALSLAVPENDLKLVYTGGQDSKIIVSKLQPTQILEHNKTHVNFVNCLRESPDGKRMVSVSNDNAIGLWTLGGATETIQKAHTGSIYSVQWFSDSVRFVTSSADKTIKVWNFDDKSCLFTLNVSDAPTLNDMQNGVACSDSRVASVSLDGSINLWNYESLAEGKIPDQSMKFHTRAVMSLAYHENSLVSFDQGGTVLKFDGDSQNPSLVASGKSCTGGFVCRLTNKAYLISYCDVWEVNFESKSVNKATSNSSSITSATTNEGGFVFADAKGGLTRGKDKIQITENSKAVNGVVAHNGGHACVDDNGGVSFVKDGSTEVLTVNLLEGNRGMSIASYPGYVVVGDDKGAVYFVKMADGEAPVVEKRIKHHYTIVTYMAVNAENTMAYSTSIDGVVGAWNLSDQTNKMMVPHAHRGTINACTWWGSRNLLATGGSDCGIKGWNM